MHHNEGMTVRGLARMFKVHTRSIGFICYPERLEANKAKRKERGGSAQYYHKEAHRLAMAAHRQYKKNIHERRTGNEKGTTQAD
jgi:hypothetical protein